MMQRLTLCGLLLFTHVNADQFEHPPVRRRLRGYGYGKYSGYGGLYGGLYGYNNYGAPRTINDYYPNSQLNYPGTTGFGYSGAQGGYFPITPVRVDPATGQVVISDASGLPVYDFLDDVYRQVPVQPQLYAPGTEVVDGTTSTTENPETTEEPSVAEGALGQLASALLSGLGGRLRGERESLLDLEFPDEQPIDDDGNPILFLERRARAGDGGEEEMATDGRAPSELLPLPPADNEVQDAGAVLTDPLASLPAAPLPAPLPAGLPPLPDGYVYQSLRVGGLPAPPQPGAEEDPQERYIWVEPLGGGPPMLVDAADVVAAGPVTRERPLDGFGRETGDGEPSTELTLREELK